MRRRTGPRPALRRRNLDRDGAQPAPGAFEPHLFDHRNSRKQFIALSCGRRVESLPDLGDRLGQVGVIDEILALKIWRRRHALRFPSFLMELATIHARPKDFPALLHFLATDFSTTRP